MPHTNQPVVQPHIPAHPNPIREEKWRVGKKEKKGFPASPNGRFYRAEHKDSLTKEFEDMIKNM